jgi:hypothetical protein
MYNFLPASGLYFYPWDIPSTLFFTLAVILFERRQILLMAAATCAGCFFKETVLVCALLVLFAGSWKWWRRILAFAAIVAVYMVGKKFLLGHLQVKAAALSMNDATNWAGLLKPNILIENLKVLFSPAAIYVIFANAGTLAVVLMLGWRRRFLPYMVLILAFLAGQFMYGNFQEFRIFMQILPLSLILLSERWRDHAGAALRDDKKRKGGGPAKKSPKASAPGWALREMFPVFRSTAIAMIVLSTIVVSWRYFVILNNRDDIELREDRLADGGSFRNFETVCAWFENGYTDAKLKYSIKFNRKEDADDSLCVCTWFAMGYGDAELKQASYLESRGRDSEAIDHYRIVLGLEPYLNTNINNHVMLLVAAHSNLAWLLATSPDPHLRNGDEALRLSERACQLTQQPTAFLIETLAAAYAEDGRLNDAVAAAQFAREAALRLGQKNVAERYEPLLKLYQSGRAYHQEASPVP